MGGQEDLLTGAESDVEIVHRRTFLLVDCFLSGLAVFSSTTGSTVEMSLVRRPSAELQEVGRGCGGPVCHARPFYNQPVSAKTRMVQLRAELLPEVERTRYPLVVPEGLANYYGSLTPEERQDVNEVLGEWLLSGDSSLYYDALFVTGQFRVTSLIPTLQVLEQRLIASPAAHDRHYAPVVRNVIRMIRSDDESA